jgi:putative transposase
MRYPASEKLEIIKLVEPSHLPVRRTLARLGVPSATFYRWYDRYQTGGVEALQDRRPKPKRVWNRIPEERRQEVLKLALDEPELSLRERGAGAGGALHRSGRLRRLGSLGLSAAQGTRPDHQPGLRGGPPPDLWAADEFKDKTSAPNELWQTDFTYLKVLGLSRFLRNRCRLRAGAGSISRP